MSIQSSSKSSTKLQDFGSQESKTSTSNNELSLAEIELIKLKFAPHLPTEYMDKLDIIFEPYRIEDCSKDTEEQLTHKIKQHRRVTHKFLEIAKAMIAANQAKTSARAEKEKRHLSLQEEWKAIQAKLMVEKQSFKEFFENHRKSMSANQSASEQAAGSLDAQTFKELSGTANSISKEFQEMYTTVLKREIKRMKTELLMLDRVETSTRTPTKDQPKSEPIPQLLLSLAQKLAPYEKPLVSGSHNPKGAPQHTSLECELLSKLPTTLSETLPALQLHYRPPSTSSNHSGANPSAIISKLNHQLNKQHPQRLRRQSASEHSNSLPSGSVPADSTKPTPQNAVAQSKSAMVPTSPLCTQLHSLKLLSDRLQAMPLESFVSDVLDLQQQKAELEEKAARAKVVRGWLRGAVDESESLLRRSIERAKFDGPRGSTTSLQRGMTSTKLPNPRSSLESNQGGLGSPSTHREVLISESKYENSSYARLYGLRNRLGPPTGLASYVPKANHPGSPTESLLRSARKITKPN